MDTHPKYVTAKQAAELLELDVDTVRRWVRRKRVRPADRVPEPGRGRTILLLVYVEVQQAAREHRARQSGREELRAAREAGRGGSHGRKYAETDPIRECCGYPGAALCPADEIELARRRAKFVAQAPVEEVGAG